MTHEEAIEILEEVKVLDDSMFAYNPAYCQALDLAIDALKARVPREPHYTRLEYLVNGMPVVVKHPECPRCHDNGLTLWDAEIKRGSPYCKRCGQAVKWGG